MPKRLDIVGQSFGWFKVIGFSHVDHSSFVKCLCKCGTSKIVRASDLTSGKTISCGCYNRSPEKAQMNREQASLPKGEASFNFLYNNYKNGALRRGYSFELTKEEFKILTLQNCYYCGIEPKQEFKCVKRANGTVIYNGIDRIDNMEGYILSNSVACCFVCNKAKSTMTIDEFRNWIIKVFSNFININQSEVA